MICLSFTVLVTNYLFGTGSRWIVFLLAGGSALAAVLVTRADGHPTPTAWADLVVQALLALAMGIAFLGIHIRHRGQHWSRKWGWQRVAGPGLTPVTGRRAGAKTRGVLTRSGRLRRCSSRGNSTGVGAGDAAAGLARPGRWCGRLGHPDRPR